MSLQDDVAEAFKRCNAQEKEIEALKLKVENVKKSLKVLKERGNNTNLNVEVFAGSILKELEQDK